MKKTARDKRLESVNKQQLFWKMADGKRYQIKTKERNGRIDKLYELQISTNSLDRFTDEEKAVFQQMESEVDFSDYDFDDLMEEVSKIKLTC